MLFGQKRLPLHGIRQAGTIIIHKNIHFRSHFLVGISRFPLSLRGKGTFFPRDSQNFGQNHHRLVFVFIMIVDALSVLTPLLYASGKPITETRGRGG